MLRTKADPPVTRSMGFAKAVAGLFIDEGREIRLGGLHLPHFHQPRTGRAYCGQGRLERVRQSIKNRGAQLLNASRIAHD